MRVLQFVTLFLALSVLAGCSHRRGLQTQTEAPVATKSLCDCWSCRADQERLIQSGAVPADHFGKAKSVDPDEPVASTELTPEYSDAPDLEVVPKSPYASGNPVEMGSDGPDQISLPVVKEIETERTPPPPKDFVPIDQLPTKKASDGVFKPFDTDAFKPKSEVEKSIPLDQQPSILIDKAIEVDQPNLGSVAPSATQQEDHFQLPELSDVDETNESQVEGTVARKLPTGDQRPVADAPVERAEKQSDTLVPPAKEFAPVAKPKKQTEVVVQGSLYANPIVLHARPRPGVLSAAPVQAQRTVQPTSIEKPVEHQSIVQNSDVDPVYGLPLSNNVDFNSLPAIQQPRAAVVNHNAALQAPATLQAPTPEAQHLHVHIHHDYANDNTTGQVRHSVPNGLQTQNVQVVYRDNDGRVIMAPPTPTTSSVPAMPAGDQRTYYIPPQPILRLKATSPINRQRSYPSVASIQMRDTIIHGGTHLLAAPDHQAKPVQTNHGLPGIDHEKLREAFKGSPNGNSLR